MTSPPSPATTVDLGPHDVAARPVIPVMRPLLGEDEARAVQAVLATGWIAQGPKVAEFEAAFAAKVGAAHAVAVSSCTTGLHLALVALGIGPGDEVVVPSLSFIATTSAVRYVGATPVFADVDEQTLNLTDKTVAEVVTPRTRAVIVVHQAGMPADLDRLEAMCDELGLDVIEDAACAIGSTYEDRPIGATARIGVFSFHPRKLLTTGEGGMLVTSDAALADRFRRLREHGTSASAAQRHGGRTVQVESYGELGFNYRMTDLQAAVGVVQLDRLDAMIERRRALAARYRAGFAAVPDLVLPVDPPYGRTNHQSFWVLLPDAFPLHRDEVLQLLLDAGISARRGIMAAHREPACAALSSGSSPVDLPVTERITDRTLILPLYHELAEADQDRVIDAVVSILTRVTTPPGGVAR